MKSAQVKKVQLICCGQGFNKEYRGHYNRYKVLIDGIPLEKICSTEELKALSYWVSRSNVMAMTCWGTSQEFEATLAIGRFLKLADEKKMEWSLFTRALKEKIEAIY